jgi:signal transduction histidine kinase/ActR/RegA family two-component response regulator
LSARDPDFKTLFEAAPGLFLVLDPDLRIVAASEAYLEATMTTREGIVGRRLFEVFPDNPDDPVATGVANLRASIERAFASGAPDTMAIQKYDVRRPDGTFDERHWSPVNTPVHGPDGKRRYLIHRVEDVTEFVRLKNEERERERQTAELRERAGSMEIELFQRAQELQGANAKLRELQAELEERVRARTEELRQREDQLRQAQKMEAIGRLAGGIAHDFNNLLSVILGYSQDLLTDLKLPAGARERIHEIELAGERAATLTRQLLAFSRQQVLEPAVFDVRDALRSVERMLDRILGEDVELRFLFADEPAQIMADRGQLEQMLLNLVVNARDAMPQGGKLTIETSVVQLDEAYARGHLGVEPGPYVLIAVSDTGIGMDKETQARAFEPFFTTKELGKGTGLGLASVYGIVQQSRGSIWLYSEPGVGTTFKIYLPRAFGAVTPLDVVPQAEANAGSETILLVEDDAQVRKITSEILQASGYRVLEARAPEEALKVGREHGGPIQLLLTDVIMPGMNGRQLAEKILAEHPGVKVLFMSGYTDDVILRHGVLDSEMAFLQKPITPASLLRKVTQVLRATVS